MKPQLGILGVLKATTHIVFLNLHYLLPVSALPFLLVYVFKALAFPAAPSSTSIFVLHDVFFVLLFCFVPVNRDLLALRSLNPNPDLNSCGYVLFNLSFVLYSVTSANCLYAVYEIGASIIVYRNFAISAMLGVTAGAVYTALTMCSLDKCYPIIEESRRWVDYLIMRCIDVVRTSIWVAAVTYGIAFFSGPQFESFLPAWIQAKADVLSVMWRWVAAGVSVSLLPNLFLCVMSTHAALYLSCRTHHKKLIDSSAPLLDEELARSGDTSIDSSAPLLDEYWPYTIRL